jgi:DNA-binding MarR family transcriptional regulator
VAQTGTTVEELLAFEIATRDLVGVALRSVADLEVSLSQFRLLVVVRELGRPSSTRCAQALGVVGSSITRLADRLDASGHLVRMPDPDNRSVVVLELTEAGRRVVEQVTTSRRRQLGQALDHLEPHERATCVAALAKLHDALAGTDDDGPRDRLPF